MSSLIINDLHVSIGEKEIIRGLTLEIPKGEVHAIMGPNGTGKSTLSKAIAGHPDYAITSGDVLLDGKSILELEEDERAPGCSSRSNTRAKSPASRSRISSAPPSRPAWPRARSSTPPVTTSGST